MQHRITVNYTAPTEIADPEQLCEYVREQVDEHFRSVDEFALRDIELHVEIHTLEFDGKVAIQFQGRVDQQPITGSLIRVTRPPKLIAERHHRRMAKRIEHRRRHGIAMRLAWIVVETFRGLGRCVFPSRVARAVGRPLSSGRVLRSLDQCLTDLRGTFDEQAGRTPTGGAIRHRVAAWLAVALVLGGIVIAGLVFARSNSPSHDPTPTLLALLATTVGLAGIVYGGTLLTLSRQFYESQRAGRQLLKRLGLKSTGAARTIGLVMAGVATVMFLLGVRALLGT